MGSTPEAPGGGPVDVPPVEIKEGVEIVWLPSAPTSSSQGGNS